MSVVALSLGTAALEDQGQKTDFECCGAEDANKLPEYRVGVILESCFIQKLPFRNKLINRRD